MKRKIRKKEKEEGESEEKKGRVRDRRI